MMKAGVAIFGALMLQGCIEVKSSLPAAFTNEDAEVVFNVDFGQPAGHLDVQGLRELMASAQSLVEIDYMPTKTIWLVNANLVTYWDGLVMPIPHWRLEPRVISVRLTPQDYQIIDAHRIHFKAKRQITTGYALHSVRVVLPAPAAMLNWPAEPLRLQIHLDPKSDAPASKASGGPTQQAPFVFDSIRYAVAGSVTASNARVLIDGVDNITTDTASPSAEAALVGSKYAGYQKALLNPQLKEEGPGRLVQQARAIQDRLRHAPACCQTTPEQDKATMDDYRAWLSKYEQACDWPSITLWDTQYSATAPDITVLESLHVHAKADGHALDNLTLETRDGKWDSTLQCHAGNQYELFFVDQKLVNYQRRNTACTGTDETGKAQVTLTHAKWNDQGRPVYFHQTCESCQGDRAQIQADDATWTAMTQFGLHVATHVLRSPDVFRDPDQARH
jgi:hypothetical protein